MDVEDEVTQLQGALAAAVAHVRSLPEDDDRYGPAADEAIDLARRLVDLEDRLPVLRDVGPQRATLLLVRGTVVALLALAAGLAVTALVLDRIGFLWVLLVPVLAGAALGVVLPRVPPTPPAAHRRHRVPAVVALLGAVAVLLAVVGVSGWLVPVGVVLLVVGGLLSWRLRDDPVRWDDRDELGQR